MAEMNVELANEMLFDELTRETVSEKMLAGIAKALGEGADPNALTPDGMTPLLLAAERLGVELGRQTAQSDTALHLRTVCEVLIEAGADLRVRSGKGWTASMLLNKNIGNSSSMFTYLKQTAKEISLEWADMEESRLRREALSAGLTPGPEGVMGRLGKRRGM